MHKVISITNYKRTCAPPTAFIPKSPNLAYALTVFAAGLVKTGAIEITARELEKCLLSPTYAKETFPEIHDGIWGFLWQRVRAFAIKHGDSPESLDRWIAQHVA